MKEIKAPNIRIRLKIKNDQVGKVEKRLPDTSQLNYISLKGLTGRTILSHAVGLLRFCKSFIYFVVLAVGSVSTAAL